MTHTYNQNTCAVILRELTTNSSTRFIYLRSIVLIKDEDISCEQVPKAPRLQPPTQAAGATDKL